MAIVLKKTVLTFLFLFLAIWVVCHGVRWRLVDSQDYTYSSSEIKRLRYFDDAWVDYGVKAWYENQLGLARRYFKNALSVNVLNLDAWLKLAQLEAEDNNRPQAVAVLRFTDHLTRQVVKWKWQQIMLARDLKEEAVFLKNINFVIAYPQLRTDALNLLDLHVAGNVSTALTILSPRNLPDYLNWLMRWRRTEDSLRVWAALTENQKRTDALHERYVNFLVAQKQIKPAVDIWVKATGSRGIANPGFESVLGMNQIFDWRARPGEFWDIQRDKVAPKEGHSALRIDFSGKENIQFAHLSQIVPVQPGVDYRLSFWWRSRDLTTDQRPSLEIRGVQCGHPGWSSEMAPNNGDWRRESIAFSVPEACYAVSLTLHRRPSYRFDCKIKGQLWLDDFQLETVKP